MTGLTIYCTGHPKSEIICSAMKAGTGAGMVWSGDGLRKDGNPAFFYGITRHNHLIRDGCVAAGRDWYLCDNGYMGMGHYDGYFRITRNAFLCDGGGRPDFDRLDRLGIEIAPSRQAGGYVLVCPPIAYYGKFWDFDIVEWLNETKRVLAQVTDRKIVIRFKPGDGRIDRYQPPLDEHLAGAWCLVTHNSNVTTEAIVAGVPVFVTGATPAAVVGSTNIREVERPVYPDNRHEWLAVLAANQWTLDEFRSGKAWIDLRSA